MKLLKDLSVCMRLIKYGKQARVGRVFGIVCFLIGLLSIAVSLFEGDVELAFFPAYFISMGLIFFFQPLMTLCYKGVMSFAPQRRAAEIFWMPMMIVAMVLTTSVIALVFGAVSAQFSPLGEKAAAYAMVTVLPVALLAGVVIVLSKLSMKAYAAVFMIFVLFPQGLVNNIEKISELFPLGGSLAANFFIVLGTGLAIALLSYFLCRAVYKKPYGEAFRKMNDMSI